MANTEQIRFRTKVCFIASKGILKTSESTLKLNLSEQYILSHLIENHSSPVTKDDLLKVGWPDRIVTEASLFQVIRALRVKLNEKNKGDVIETLPKIGYQIREFTRGEVNLTKQKTNNIIRKINKKTIISLGIITTILFSSCAWYMSPYQITPTNFLIEHENIGSNNITFITKNLEQQVDLRNKAKAIFSAQADKNQKIYFYKSHDYYSIAWCQIMVDTNQCKPRTDFSYKIAPDAWGKFVQNIVDNKKRFHEKIENYSDLMREPLSIVYRSYISNSGMILKISNFYISPTSKSNVFDYSKVNFITNNKTGRYQAQSISAESLTLTRKYSQFIATLEITPKIFHWAYQNNASLSSNKAIIFSDDDNETNMYEKNTIHYEHIVMAQKRLKLILNENSGIYWLHSSRNNPLTLLQAEHYK
ncbi:winged helix-turn-helix domain-containing protein [Photobacterium piscicola]|uniref:Winged helix-turn-helix domain-containing protein n=1 Tax=Photobacterium piscicola TaxID=1378299 RepID=A0ABU6LKG6_9GAMM|nr:winged helix-turn-helix domain-containing protein [Photobacterium piscicola]MEC6881907.1 winged helix-turn-helix domain-containing protein [Photobacterium piscicola]MEC6898445.1 winged helix-turn-helix domain-containing protein [Photobacterium piscicola]